MKNVAHHPILQESSRWLLQLFLKGIQGDNQDEAVCALGKQAEQALRYIERKFYEPCFLRLPILRKAIKSLTKMPVPHT